MYKLPESIAAELNIYCYLVERGKPAAMLPVQTRYVDEATRIIKNNGLNSYVTHLTEEWSTVWVYKYPYLLDVIKMTPQAPKTTFDHWVLGKLFGYSEEAIQDFILQFSKSRTIAPGAGR